MTDQPRWPAGTPIRPDGHGPGGGRFRPTRRVALNELRAMLAAGKQVEVDAPGLGWQLVTEIADTGLGPSVRVFDPQSRRASGFVHLEDYDPPLAVRDVASTPSRYHPTSGYAGSWVQQLSDRIAPPGRMSHEQLAQYVGRDDYEVIGGGGGGTSDVVFRRYSDGRVLVYKRFHGTAMPAVAEVEASLIGQAIGAPVPAALRDPDHEYSIYMEYVEADPQHAHENYRGGGVYAQRRLALIDWMDQLIDDEHPDALMLGLLDVLIGNADRHPMNVVRTPGDHIVGIDHGEAFWADYFQQEWPDIDVPAKAMAGAGRLGRRLLKYDANTDRMSLLYYSAEDIRRVRERLAPLRPLLRGEIGDGLFRALDTLERVATGTGRHID